MTLKCRPISSTTEFNINIMFHVIILFTFLTIFYVFFASKLIKDTFNNQFKSIIDSNVSKAIDNIAPDQRNQLKLLTQVINYDKLLKKYQTSDTYVKEHNKWMERTAIGVIIVGVVLLITIIGLLYNNCGQCTPFWNIIIENIIVFAFVGVVEYLFFVNVAFKYIPTPPSVLITSLLNKFKTSLIESA